MTKSDRNYQVAAKPIDVEFDEDVVELGFEFEFDDGSAIFFLTSDIYLLSIWGSLLSAQCNQSSTTSTANGGSAQKQLCHFITSNFAA